MLPDASSFAAVDIIAAMLSKSKSLSATLVLKLCCKGSRWIGLQKRTGVMKSIALLIIRCFNSVPKRMILATYENNGKLGTLFYLGDPDTINYDCRVLWWENGQRTPLCFLEKLGFTHSTHLRAPTQARCLEHLLFSFGSVGNKTTAVRKCAHAKVVSKITLVGDTFGV